jgi:glutamine amidotransferase
MIGVVDYGAGNLRSVLKAFQYLGLPARIVDQPGQLRSVQKIVIPGVGAFGAAAEKLEACGFRGPIMEWSAEGRPLLGICLGMQLFMDTSEETPGANGLGIIAGHSRRLPAGKVPQIGWNRVKPKVFEPLFVGLSVEVWMYFLHSYYAVPDDPSSVVATAQYGVRFPAALRLGSAVGVQFHPEKSSTAGLVLLKNWGQA